MILASQAGVRLAIPSILRLQTQLHLHVLLVLSSIRGVAIDDLDLLGSSYRPWARLSQILCSSQLPRRPRSTAWRISVKVTLGHSSNLRRDACRYRLTFLLT